MSDVPMPRDLSEEAVAEWLHNIAAGSNPGMQVALRARAVRALLREKVREAVAMDRSYSRATEGLRKGSYFVEYHMDADAIVSRVLGDHPEGGHEAEGREAPRA